jgi:hypothetical protein
VDTVSHTAKLLSDTCYQHCCCLFWDNQRRFHLVQLEVFSVSSQFFSTVYRILLGVMEFEHRGMVLTAFSNNFGGGIFDNEGFYN